MSMTVKMRGVTTTKARAMGSGFCDAEPALTGSGGIDTLAPGRGDPRGYEPEGAKRTRVRLSPLRHAISHGKDRCQDRGNVISPNS